MHFIAPEYGILLQSALNSYSILRLFAIQEVIKFSDSHNFVTLTLEPTTGSFSIFHSFHLSTKKQHF